MTVRVLIADDQQLVRAGFRLILERQPGIEVVGEAASGAEAVTLARRFTPDVVLMDIRMPDLDGIQATRLIRANPGLETSRIIILTTFDLDEYVYLALRAGASGFAAQGLCRDQDGHSASGRRSDAPATEADAPSSLRDATARLTSGRPSVSEAILAAADRADGARPPPGGPVRWSVRAGLAGRPRNARASLRWCSRWYTRDWIERSRDAERARFRGRRR